MSFVIRAAVRCTQTSVIASALVMSAIRVMPGDGLHQLRGGDVPPYVAAGRGVGETIRQPMAEDVAEALQQLDVQGRVRRHLRDQPR